MTKIIFYVQISQVSAVVRYTNVNANFCVNFSCWRLGEVEVVQHNDVLLLLAVQVDVPAQLGEEQQLTGLKILEFSWSVSHSWQF